MPESESIRHDNQIVSRGQEREREREFKRERSRERSREREPEAGGVGTKSDESCAY